MAINVSFNGATIYKPGSYSRTNIDLGGGFPLGPAGLIAVIGEADAGAPGASEVNIASNRYTADQLVQIRDKYRSGPIADSAAMLFAPAADAAIPSGAQTVWFYKTNASVRASLTLAASYGTVRAREWGVGGNRLSYTSTLVGETAPTHASSAPFDETTIASGDKLVLHVMGTAANTFTASGSPANNAALAAQLALAGNWSGGLPTGISIVVGGADGASTVSFTLTAAPTQHTLGFGRSFQLAAGSPNILTKMNLVAGLKTAAVEPSVTLKLDQKRDNVQEEESMGGNIVLTIGHDGTGSPTSASVTIDATNVILNINGSPEHTLPKGSYATLKDLADELNLVTYGGWSAAVANAAYNQLPLSDLDQVTTVGALATGAVQPARIKKDASEVQDFFDLSILGELVSPAAKGLPGALVETLLSGGARGATSPASIVAALEKFEKFHVNSIVPLFARDASADITDGLTDSGSTYTIAGIHQAVKTHISLMKTTKRRSERQGYLALKASYDASVEQTGVLADGRIQLAIQDIRQTDAQGAIRWFQPWALAAQLAGARGGAPIGEPLTFKFLNLAGIRHTAQAMSTPDASIVIDFDPDLQADDAIQAGITFLEAPQTGGFRVVVDNTTYGRDGNFVFNRANVLYAADIVAFNFRNALENVFIGRKNTVTVADVAGVAASTLTTFLAQGITVSTADAPQGYKNLVVRIEGNTIYVEVIIKLVEGIDFVLSDITIQRASA
jgi:hypothetical protein